MPKEIAIGIQSFEEIIKQNYFYIDKTDFIKEWWESGDVVTLITRPRRFGKTLNMSMLECFFSLNYAGRGDLFEGLSIWQEEKYRQLQGTYPVISLSFAGIKESDFETTSYQIRKIIKNQYEKYSFLQESDVLSEAEKTFFKEMTFDVKREDMAFSLNQLSEFLYRYYGKKVIIFLDEYDTPMQEAYVHGYWDDLVVFTRSLFNSTFKTNSYLHRAVMTGITRVSKESVFSDLNHLKVITTTSDEYATAFGFTEKEVFEALDNCNLGEKKEKVKSWYDGFVFGNHKDIYNPWSILNFIDTKGKFAAYWANTSSNALVGKLICQGSKKTKTTFEALLRDEVIHCPIDEQIVYNQLDTRESAIWSLLIASGYLKVLDMEKEEEMTSSGYPVYDLALTNYEVKKMFLIMVGEWFEGKDGNYGEFINALLNSDIESMNEYINEITMESFSYFDTGAGSLRSSTERFYHGFVLGLLTSLSDRYRLTSNLESGLGRYDVMLEPKNLKDNAYILEFKVHNPKKEDSMEATVENALKQIEEKQYEASLIARGFDRDKIRKYGFAFEGKKVLIGE